MSADVVQKVTVVGYDDDSTEILREEVLQPGNRLDIKVVGRLVHQYNIRISEQALCEKHLDLFVTGEGIHLLGEYLLGKSQSLYKLGSIGFRLPAVELSEFRLQLGSAGAVLLGEILLGIECVFLLHDVVKALVAENNGVLHGVVIERVVILSQHGHTQLSRLGYAALGRFEVAAEHL